MSKQKVSNALFIVWAGGAALVSYALVYALRKPFTAATFEGLEFLGMDYKTATSIVQIAGYVLSKLLGIKLVSELQRRHRLPFLIGSVAMAELSLLAFGLLPVPWNIVALFFNGLSLGCMWGVIFSYLEGRRLSGVLASVMGMSIACSSALAKSAGLYLIRDLGVDPFWMPAIIGGVAFVLLVVLAFALNALPDPSAEDRAACAERVPMDGRQRRQIFLRFAPLLTMLFAANLFVTVIRDIKEDFLVNIVDTSQLSAWAFSGVDAVVTAIILLLFLAVSLIRSHLNVLCTLLVLVLVSMFALVYVAWNYDWLALSPLAWLFVQSLGVYTAFLSFQTLFFERFVACYHIRGNVGFFIVTIDFIGYVGTVGVLVFKELFAGELDWLAFYNSMVVWLGLASCLLFAGSLLWLARGRSLTLGGDWKRRAAVWEEPDTVTA